MQQNRMNNGCAKYEDNNCGRNKSCGLKASMTKQDLAANGCKPSFNNDTIQKTEKDSCHHCFNRVMSEKKQEKLFSDLSIFTKRDKDQNELNRSLIKKEKEYRQKMTNERNQEMQFVIDSIDKRNVKTQQNKKRDRSTYQVSQKEREENLKAAQQVHDRCIRHQLLYHRDLDDKVQDLLQLKREGQICDLEFDRKIKEVQYETYQRDLDEKHKVQENEESLKLQVVQEQQRKLSESNERKGPSSSAAYKDVESFEKKERRRDQQQRQKRNKDMQKQLHLHRVKLENQKELKAIEHEEERDIIRKLDHLGIQEISYQCKGSESRNNEINKAQNESEEPMQTVFKIDESDKSFTDLGGDVRNEMISQDIRKHYYKIEIQNKYNQDLKQQAEERHIQRKRQLNESLNQTLQNNLQTYESCVKKAGRKQRDKEFVKDLSFQKSVDKCQKSEEVKIMRKPPVPSVAKVARKQREKTMNTKNKEKAALYEHHQQSVDEKRIKKCIYKKKDNSMVNTTVTEEIKTGEIEGGVKSKKIQNSSVIYKSPAEKDQHKRRVERLFRKQVPGKKSKEIYTTTVTTVITKSGKDGSVVSKREVVLKNEQRL